MIDAFYQAYRDIEKVRTTIKNFLNNGGGQVCLVSDKGDDFSSLIHYFGEQLIYRYEDINVRVGYWNNKFECREWFSRLFAAAKRVQGERILILEEDVLIRGDISQLTFKHEIVGPRGHTTNYINHLVQAFIKKHGKGNGDYEVYGGCGGSVFNRNIFLNVYENFIEFLMEHYDELDKLSNTLIRHQDYCLTLLFNLEGYEYGENPYYTEPLYGHIFLTERHEKPIVHHFDEI